MPSKSYTVKRYVKPGQPVPTEVWDGVMMIHKPTRRGNFLIGHLKTAPTFITGKDLSLDISYEMRYGRRYSVHLYAPYKPKA